MINWKCLTKENVLTKMSYHIKRLYNSINVIDEYVNIITNSDSNITFEALYVKLKEYDSEHCDVFYDGESNKKLVFRFKPIPKNILIVYENNINDVANKPLFLEKLSYVRVKMIDNIDIMEKTVTQIKNDGYYDIFFKFCLDVGCVIEKYQEDMKLFDIVFKMNKYKDYLRDIHKSYYYDTEYADDVYFDILDDELI